MSEPTSPVQPGPATAGAMLRQARQARGLHLMALSASLKVPPARLEAIEEDRWQDLPDAAYARALAHTVSRSLGIDPEPVLRSLPTASHARLESLDEGLNQPFREFPKGVAVRLGSHRWIVVGIGLVLAAAVWWWLASGTSLAGPGAQAPAGGNLSGAASAPTAPAAASPGSASAGAAGTNGLASTVPGLAGGSGAPAPGVAVPTLRVVATQASWIELRDPQGQTRLSRLVSAGETLEQPFVPPLGLTVGNAAATQVWVNGQAIDLASGTRENVARIELR